MADVPDLGSLLQQAQQMQQQLLAAQAEAAHQLHEGTAGGGAVKVTVTGGMEFQSVNHDCSSDGDCQAEFSCYGGTCAPTIIPN